MGDATSEGDWDEPVTATEYSYGEDDLAELEDEEDWSEEDWGEWGDEDWEDFDSDDWEDWDGNDDWAGDWKPTDSDSSYPGVAAPWSPNYWNYTNTTNYTAFTAPPNMPMDFNGVAPPMPWDARGNATITPEMRAEIAEAFMNEMGDMDQRQGGRGNRDSYRGRDGDAFKDFDEFESWARNNSA